MKAVGGGVVVPSPDKIGFYNEDSGDLLCSDSNIEVYEYQPGCNRTDNLYINMSGLPWTHTCYNGKYMIGLILKHVTMVSI